MKLEEAKKYLNDCGFILEDTETLDDEINDLENQVINRKKPDSFIMNKKQAKKFGKLWDKVRDSSLEKKTNKAVNFNMRNFYKGLEEKLSEHWKHFEVEPWDYDTKQNFQAVSYWFNNDRLEFQVDYWDEKGEIQLGLIDVDKSTRKDKKIKITNIDKNILEVFTWFWEKVDNYDQDEW